jgi:hypothetical protein
MQQKIRQKKRGELRTYHGVDPSNKTLLKDAFVVGQQPWKLPMLTLTSSTFLQQIAESSKVWV